MREHFASVAERPDGPLAWRRVLLHDRCKGLAFDVCCAGRSLQLRRLRARRSAAPDTIKETAMRHSGWIPGSSPPSGFGIANVMWLAAKGKLARDPQTASHRGQPS
jgi:hypothetical protein